MLEDTVVAVSASRSLQLSMTPLKPLRSDIVSVVTLAMYSVALVYFAVTQFFLVPTVSQLRLGGSSHSNEISRAPNTPAYGLLTTLAAFPACCCIIWLRLVLCKPSLIKLSAAVSLSLLAGLWIYTVVGSRWSLLCDYNWVELEKLCTFSQTIVQNANADPALGVGSMFLHYGTLLAAVRGPHRSLLIANDHDVDICVAVDKREALTRMLREKGYFFEAWQEPWGPHKIRVYPEWVGFHTGHEGPLCVDFFFEDCKTFADKFGAPVHVEPGCNGLPFPLPRDHEGSLEMAFGEDWRTPRNVNHQGMCIVTAGLGWI